MSKTEEVKKELTDALKEKYDYLSADDVERAYNYALADRVRDDLCYSAVDKYANGGHLGSWGWKQLRYIFRKWRVLEICSIAHRPSSCC